MDEFFCVRNRRKRMNIGDAAKVEKRHFAQILNMFRESELRGKPDAQVCNIGERQVYVQIVLN